MLRITTLFAIAIAAAQPVLAAPHEDHGEAEGERFEYSTKLEADGVIHFNGVILGSGDKFMLNVARNGRVNGYFGHQAVDYTVGKRVRDKVAAQLGEGPAVTEASLGR
jgi:hypothetical protein